MLIYTYKGLRYPQRLTRTGEHDRTQTPPTSRADLPTSTTARPRPDTMRTRPSPRPLRPTKRTHKRSPGRRRRSHRSRCRGPSWRRTLLPRRDRPVVPRSRRVHSTRSRTSWRLLCRRLPSRLLAPPPTTSRLAVSESCTLRSSRRSSSTTRARASSLMSSLSFESGCTTGRGGGKK